MCGVPWTSHLHGLLGSHWPKCTHEACPLEREAGQVSNFSFFPLQGSLGDLSRVQQGSGWGSLSASPWEVALGVMLGADSGTTEISPLPGPDSTLNMLLSRRLILP